ncbi:PIG-L family deacetylase [Patescibacteria group bacterium]|nr:PIG-L family deacetylase [Patescibacteria group bacterium]
MNLESAQRPVAIYAHPDDEVIGCSYAIYALRDRIHCLFVTDGMPLQSECPEYYFPHTDYTYGESYIQMRRSEAVAALSALGFIDNERLHFLGFTDGGLAEEYETFRNALKKLLESIKPDLIITHAYEGGHIDHDLTCAAVWELTGGENVWICETPIYSVHGGKIRHNHRLERHNDWGVEEHTCESKKRAFEEYPSQQIDLCYFETQRPEIYAFCERLRGNVDDFQHFPNGGEMLYERTCKISFE